MRCLRRPPTKVSMVHGHGHGRPVVRSSVVMQWCIPTLFDGQTHDVGYKIMFDGQTHGVRILE